MKNGPVPFLPVRSAGWVFVLTVPVVAALLLRGAVAGDPVAAGQPATGAAPTTPTATASPLLPPASGPSVPDGPQRTFADPAGAVDALVAAVRGRDRAALHALFGPEGRTLLSGDRVEDRNALDEFAQALGQYHHAAQESVDRVVLSIGSQDWPFPIPLVRRGGRWLFDTAAGRDEIVNRRIGANELTAIGVCRTYVAAQREYAEAPRDGSGRLHYAQQLRSAPGLRDGLFWEPADGEGPSPLGPLVALARSEGYGPGKPGAASPPFHGYLFRILTAQGAHAPGGAYSYVINGGMVAGFALVAHPIRWGESGIMSFLVSGQGVVYQCDLGPDTTAVVSAMGAFDPDEAWTPVPHPGGG